MRRIAEILGQVPGVEVYTLTFFKVNYKMEDSAVPLMYGECQDPPNHLGAVDIAAIIIQLPFIPLILQVGCHMVIALVHIHANVLLKNILNF